MSGDAMAAQATTLPGERLSSRRSPWRRFLSIGEARVGVGLLALVLAVAFFGPLLAPFPPAEIGTGPPLESPSSAHLLGTDQLGRDVFSRLLSGGASVLFVPLVGTAISLALAMVLGMSAGYLGGRIDAVFTRVLDVFLAVPPLLTVLVVIAGFGTGNLVLITALVLVYAPKSARVLRGAAQNLRTREFVLAAQARGERLWWIVGREIAPNMWPTLLVEAAIRITYAIIFVATLNFLGLGVQPPSSNWGLMVAEGRSFITTDPLLCLAPAAAIAVLVVGIHLVSDALAEVLEADPSRQGER